MDKLKLGEIASAVRGKLISGSPDDVIDNVSIDSRKVDARTLFVPLIGENHDGHVFARGALENGCGAFLISEEDIKDDLVGAGVILVGDTSKALCDLAYYYLAGLDIKKIAVTGSVGKTTTRDMVYYIASSKYKTRRPEKNFNNEVGVPLTIFSLDSSYEVCVFEEGLHVPGDIHRLSAITRPDVAVITNVGVSHLENFESRYALYRGKLEVADFMGPDDALIVNSTCDIIDKDSIEGAYKVISCGDSEGDDYIVKDVDDRGVDGVSFTLTAEGKDHSVKLPVPGAHNAMNAALAIAAAARIGIKPEEAVRALKDIELTGERLKVERVNDKVIIDDSYNAAPDSVMSALDTLMNSEGERHVAILAGMNELGEDSRELHRETGRYAADKNVELIIGVGDKAEDMIDGAVEKGANAVWYANKESLFAEIDSVLRPGDVILVKGSNAYGMSEVCERIAEKADERGA